MKIVLPKKTLIFLMMFSQLSYATSGVYLFELYLHNEYYAQPPGFPSKFSLVPTVASIHRTNANANEHRIFASVLETVRLTYKQLWIEFFTNIGKEQLTVNCGDNCYKKSRAGFDDFLIDLGYNFLLDQKGKVQLLPHFIIGIPTFWKVTPLEVEDPLLGSRAITIGPAIECAYDFIRTKEQDIFFGSIFRLGLAQQIIKTI